MNAGLGKKIGVSTESRLFHRLLWSSEDACLLVAIQDIVTGTVVTVLTLDMYKRDYAENLSEGRVKHVINQMVHAGHVPEHMWQPNDNHEHVIVHAHLTDCPKPIALGGWPGEIKSPDLRQLGKLHDFWGWVAQRLHQKQHDVSHLMLVEARFKGGRSYEVPYLLPSVS